MSEQNKVEEPIIHEKISLKDLDFDNLDLDELLMIKDEIDVVLNIRKLVGERLDHVKRQLNEEKEVLRKQMLKELKKERDRLREEEEEDEESSERIIYDKKAPRGRAIKSKPKGRPPPKKK